VRRAGGATTAVCLTAGLVTLAALIALFVALSAEAGTERAAACPAPRPVPAGLEKPPENATATQLANFLLALPQRKPCDVNLFTSKFQPGDWPGLYPEGRPMAPAVDPNHGVPRDEAEVRAQLASFLRKHLGSGARVNAALALFGRSDVRARVADPTLRAALVALTGTVAEPVIEWFVSQKALKVDTRFGGVPLGGSASVSGLRPNLTMLFSRRYAAEHFALLSSTFAHEILHLHGSGQITATEEVIVHAVTAVVHMQLLARHPELATGGTELARQANQEVLLFMNSRTPGSSRSAIIAPGGRGTAPGSTRSRRDLYGHGKEWNLFRQQAPLPTDSSPTPPPFAKVLRALLATGVAIPRPLNYTKQTALLFSKTNDTWLAPVDRLRVSVLLGLVSVEEIVTYTGVPRARAVSMLQLAPILAAMK
jgi:hypothetical protein